MSQPIARRPPTVLVAAADDESLRDLAGALASRGYAVLRARSGREVMGAVRGGGPDAIVLAATLPDMGDVELFGRLAGEPCLSPYAALFIHGPPARALADRLAALRAGAWDILDHPVNIEELALKLARFTRLKHLAEQAAGGNLVDAETGLYNLQGVARRIEELGAFAVRARASLACVVLAPEGERDTPAEVAAVCARAIKTGTRHSDVLGRLSPAEFAVVAPATGSNGAIRLAQRLAGLIRESARRPLKLRAGYDAVGNLAYTPVSAVDLLVRARRAWRLADIESRLGWIRPYEEISTP